jgi:hypothetical protein
MFGKGEQCHGWHMGAGHVRYKLIKSKYLENQIFEACENHSINFAQDVPKNFIRIFDILTIKNRHTNSMAVIIKINQQRVL